jgi:hypothetical protein
MFGKIIDHVSDLTASIEEQHKKIELTNLLAFCSFFTMSIEIMK